MVPDGLCANARTEASKKKVAVRMFHSLECQSGAELEGSRSGAFGALKRANRAEGRRIEGSAGRGVIRVVEQIRRRGAHLQSELLSNRDRFEHGEGYRLRAGSVEDANA